MKLNKWWFLYQVYFSLLQNVWLRSTGVQTHMACMSLTVCWLKHSQLWIPSLWQDSSEQAEVQSSPTARTLSAGVIKQPGLHLLLAASLPSPPTLELQAYLRRIVSATVSLWYTQPMLQIGQVFRRSGEAEWVHLTGRAEVAKSAIMFYFQGAKKSHHWLNHLYNIRWFQQFHLMRKSPLLL